MTAEQLNKISEHVPHSKFTEFCEQLGIPYVRASNILETHNKDYTKALRECLEKWKARTGGERLALVAALEKVELSGIVRDLAL